MTALRLATLLAAAAAVPAGAAAAPAPSPDAPAAREVLVRYAPGADPSGLAADAGAVDAAPIGVPRALRLVLPPGADRAAALADLRARDDVAWAEPAVVYRALRTPSDPLFVRQWGLRNTGAPVGDVVAVPGADIDATAAWDVTVGDPSVTVGVVDSGIAWDHPDLAPNVSAADPGDDFVDGDRDPRDMDGHGTLVAGVIDARGDDGVGVAGVSWRSRLVGLRALDAEGSGSSASVAQAFAAAGRRGLRIVNASLGGPGLSQAVASAVAASPGTLFVVAAGNDGADVDTTPTYPCALPAANVVCVASVDAADRLADSSNYGAQSVDLAAPGVDVTGPAPAYEAPVFADDFETPLSGRWVRSAGSAWDRSAAAASGSAGLSDSPSGPYAGPEDTLIQTASDIDLTGRQGCLVFMSLRLATRQGDTLRLRVSDDGGASWRTIDSWSGSSGGRFVPVSAYVGTTTRVRLQLRLTATTTGGTEGADVDDLRVACQGGAYDATDYVTESGTSFASPHVAGVAALVAARHPGFTAAQIKQAILEGVDPVPSLAGRVLTGGRLNALGALRAADRIAGAPSGATAGPAPIAADPAPARLRATLAAPRHRAGVWTAELRLSRGALAEILFARRIARPRARFVTVRSSAPRDRRAGLVRYRLGRLGPGLYRVTVRLPEDGRVLRRTFRVTAPPRRR